MRRGKFPDPLKCLCACPGYVGIAGQLIPEERPVTCEEPKAHELVIEDPVVGQRDEQAGGSVPGKPADQFPGRDVELRRLELEAGVIGQRFGDDPRTAEADANQTLRRKPTLARI